MAAHCDSNVVHSPGKCSYCDLYPEIQQLRIDHNINFTDESDDSKQPDPATLARDINTINAWAGNQPKGPGVTAAEKHKLDKGQSFASKVLYGPWDFSEMDDDNETPDTLTS